MDLRAKAAAAGGSKAWELIRRGASNEVISKAVTKAGERAATRAATNAADGATKRGSAYLAGRLDDRKHRLLAMDLARQIGGQVSIRTVIAGERCYIVWRGDEPVDSFPMLPKAKGPLAERPELSGFVGRRVTPRPNELLQPPAALRRRRIEYSRCRFRLDAGAGTRSVRVARRATSGSDERVRVGSGSAARRPYPQLADSSLGSGRNRGA